MCAATNRNLQLVIAVQSIVSKAFEQEKEILQFSSFTLRTKGSIVDTKHMPDYDVTRMKQINKHEKASRVSNFFIAFSVTCDL